MLRLACQLLRFSTLANAKPSAVYKEVALPGQAFYAQLTKRAFRVQKEEIFRLYDMFEKELLPANHDFINESGLRLLSFQKQLNLQELICVLRVCVKFQVSSLPLVRHLENELYTRYFLQLGSEIVRVKDERERAKKEKYKELNKNNNDYFELLTPEFVEEQTKQPEKFVGTIDKEEDEQTEEADTPQPQSVQLVASYVQQYGQLTLDQICLLANLLVRLDCEETRLLRLFEEYFLTVKQPTVEQLVTFVRVHSHICRRTDQEYNKNKEVYAVRSVKRLQKYHEHFFLAMAPTLKQLTPNMQQLHQMLNAIVAYPPKRRSIKRSLLTTFLRAAGQDASATALQNCKLVRTIMGTDTKLLKLIEDKHAVLLEIQKKSLQRTTDQPASEQRTFIFS